jgi:RNA recognition motif-containing protein
MATALLFSNVPVECSDEVLSRWIEVRGYSVVSVRLILDRVSGTSPSFAHVELSATTKLDEAVRDLDGQMLEGRTLHVKRLPQSKKAARAGG